jgi:hypothetical protein
MKGNAGALVIPGDEIDGDAARGDLDQGHHRHFDEPGWYFTAKEQISAVNDQIDFASECRLQSPSEIVEKVVSASPSGDARLPLRKVEADVGVGNKKNSHI